MALIALVAIVAMVDGQRHEFQPGDDVTEDLHPHDIEQLKKVGAIEDSGENVSAEKEAAKQQKALAAEFAEQRKAQIAADESKATGTPPEKKAKPKDTKAAQDLGDQKKEQ